MTRPLVRPARLLLDDRGEDHRLFRRLHHDIGVALLPHLGEELLLPDLHALDDVLAAVADLEPIGVGQQRPFRGDLGDVCP